MSEVSSLLGLLEEYFRTEAAKCAAEAVRLRVIGRRDRLPPSLKQAIDAAERATATGRALNCELQSITRRAMRSCAPRAG